VDARDSRSRRSAHPSRGQHLLRSERVASELVEDADVGSDDVVLEIGAGRGRLTRPLAHLAGSVVAVEIDGRLISTLQRQFVGQTHVDVVHADFLAVPLPREPFRAFGNLPFGSTTSIVKRLLDDPGGALARADLIVQHEVARKRASRWPGNLLSLGWLPWWEFRLGRHLYASAFEPPPSVDAGVLTVERRRRALLPVNASDEYRAFLREGFRRADLPMHRAVRGYVTPGALKRVLRERGIPATSRASDLDVFDWVRLFSVARGATGQIR
jgi:23S rRNA (adenine-N6)-dimethyltransferase